MLKHPYANDYYQDIHGSLYQYEKLYRLQPKRTAFRIAVWNLLYLLRRSEKRNRESEKKQQEIELNKKCINIAFVLAGGYGDYLLFANWLWYFREKYCNRSRIRIYIVYHINSVSAVFDDTVSDIILINGKETYIAEDTFDVTFRFCVYPELIQFKKKKIKAAEKSLYEYLLACEKYRSENELFFDKHPALDGMMSARSIIGGAKRIQEPDLYGLLGITEEYKHRIHIAEDEEEYLQKLGLKKKKFITIHRGWDGTSSNNVKAWSLKACGDLIAEVKNNFADYEIVLIGTDEGQAPKDLTGLDMNLIGKTSLEQVKVLLKNAWIHIDNEGGMVHLRHALHGGKSIVLFGPTALELFGYSENTNISANNCALFCEWLTSDWPTSCPRCDSDEVPCMDAITTTMVIDALEKCREYSL